MKTLAEKLRHEIETCSKSRYSISKSTGIDEAALCRFMQGGSIKIETVDKLLDYFGYKLVKKKISIGFEFGKKTTTVVIGKKKR